jgi:hypothetical protein
MKEFDKKMAEFDEADETLMLKWKFWKNMKIYKKTDEYRKMNEN